MRETQKNYYRQRYKKESKPAYAALMKAYPMTLDDKLQTFIVPHRRQLH